MKGPTNNLGKASPVHKLGIFMIMTFGYKNYLLQIQTYTFP